MKHVLRNPDVAPPLDYREWMREHCPSSQEGLTVDDADIVSMRYGPLAGGARPGLLKLIEIKHNNGRMTLSQKHSYRTMHDLMRAADPNHEKYEGFYLVHWGPDGPRSINGRKVTNEEFVKFMTGELKVRGLWD
jgi:hypothetical protein